jgi:hypothetical protein
MKKIKRLLVAISIIVLVVASFSGIALSAQVIDVNKLNGDIRINGGENDGFIVGKIVCFTISLGEEVVCGRIQRASVSDALVKVEREWSERILEGTDALLYLEKEKMKENEETKKEQKKIKKEDWFK